MKKTLLFLAGAFVANIITLMLALYISSPKVSPIENYSNVCAITSTRYDVVEVGGAGVLVDNKHVVTNRHVVDRNYNGILEDHEVSIQCCFYDSSGIPKAINARVITFGGTPMDGNIIRYINMDIALVQLDEEVECKTQLVSNAEYHKFKICDELYTIGCPAGRLPPHITFGVRSADVDYYYDRAGISVYYGNSGGGVFSYRTGELIGLLTRVAIDSNESEVVIVPGFAEYLRAARIRDFLDDNLEPQTHLNMPLLISSLIYIGVIIGVVFGFRRHLFGS